jgi:hypothetical protein
MDGFQYKNILRVEMSCLAQNEGQGHNRSKVE